MTAIVAGASGFITSSSSLGADLSLLVTIAASALLTVGVVLARRRRYDVHRWTQTGGVLLIGVPIVFWMMRSFSRYIAPGLPGTLHEHGHLLAAVHAAVGAVGIVFGVALVVLGHTLWTRGQSLRAYRPPMRASYIVFMAGLVLGIALYVVTYG